MKPNKISNTAAFLAIKFYGLTQKEEFRQLFDDSIIKFYDRVVVHLPAPLRFYHYWLQFGWVRKLYIMSEELLLPGDLLHVIARKYFIHEKVQNLVDEGYEQIVILGAGFDHLGFYFAQRGIRCLECDVPKMANTKRSLLEKIYPETEKPEIVQVFFPDGRIDNILEKSQLDAHKKTIVVAEGFFDYLEKETVADILDQLGRYFSEKSAIISTHFALDELPLFYRKIYKLSILLAGEKLTLKSSKADYRTLIKDNGFNTLKHLNKEKMQRKLSEITGKSLQLLKGFSIFYIH